MQKRILISGSLVLLIISIAVNTGIGAFTISWGEISDAFMMPRKHQLVYQVLIDIRIPRILLAILVGLALGISGLMMQTLFKNPLADPSIIGISAGASGGVVMFMMFSSLLPTLFYEGIGAYISLPVSAFLGAVLTILFIYKIAMIYNKVAVTIMLLAGIAVNALLGALIGLFTYISTQEELKSFMFWTMGSLANANWKTVALLSVIIGISYVILMNKRIELNLLLLGENEAKNIGVNVEQLKKVLIVMVALCVGTTIAFCGIIGFIGLVVPHIARLIVGANHKFLLPLSAIFGALVVLWADALARVIIEPAELPIGIITAMIGSPFFLWLLLKNKQAY